MTSVYFYLSVIILISSVSDVKSKGQTIEERIKHDPDLSEVGLYPVTIFSKNPHFFHLTDIIKFRCVTYLK